MTTVLEVINGSFNFLNKNVHRVLKSDSSRLHNKMMLQIMNNVESRKTWEGNFCCGATVERLQHYLKRHDIITTRQYKQIGRCRQTENHVFLTLHKPSIPDMTIIIDPTWRQFLRSYSDTYDPYLKEIYENNPFIFTGTYEDLEILYEKLEHLHFKHLHLPFFNKENLLFYKNYRELDYLTKFKLDY
tara:strand:+ start:501 stop:1061 length:561 start_codon:yes stop_codon:yes gene_type:complete